MTFTSPQSGSRKRARNSSVRPRTRDVRRGASLVAVLVAMTIMVGGCGSDDDAASTPVPSEATEATEAATPASSGTAVEAMRAYFTAINTGDTKTICALSDDTLKMFLYNSTGDACLENGANQNAQSAIPDGDRITIVSSQEEPESAQYLVNDEKGASITVLMWRVDGRWLVHVFT